MIKRQSESAGQPRRVQRVRSMVIGREEDPALFQEMRNREQNNYLHPSKEDIEATLTTKFGGISGYRIMAPLTPMKGAGDLLNSEAEKNDYDWLLTPPATPLFPSLDQEESSAIHYHRDRSPRSSHLRRSLGISKRQDYSASTVPRMIASPRQAGFASNAIHSNGRLRMQNAIAPSVASRSPSSRASTPTKRSVSPNFRKSSSGSVRSDTPTARRSTSPHRSSTPTVRASTPTSRSVTPSSGPLNPIMRRSLSSPIGSSVNSGRRSSSRGNSPSRKSVTVSLVDLGLPSEPPPNLRTTLSERSTPASRGISYTKVRRNKSMDEDKYFDALDLRLSEQRPASPSLSISSSSASHETEVYSSVSSRDSVISPCQREVVSPAWRGQMSSYPGIHPKKNPSPSNGHIDPHLRRSAKTYTGRKASFSTRGNPRRAEDIVSWQKDTRQSTPRGFRPLMASSHPNFFYSSTSRVADHLSGSVTNSLLHGSSVTSSEGGIAIAPESECGDSVGEGILKNHQNGTPDGKTRSSLDLKDESSSSEKMPCKDDKEMARGLEVKDAGYLLAPQDLNSYESKLTQKDPNLPSQSGMGAVGTLKSNAISEDSIFHEDGCDENMCSCNNLPNFCKGSKIKSEKASDMLKGLGQDYCEEADENINNLKDDVSKFLLLTGAVAIQEESKSHKAIPDHATEFQAELQLTQHESVPHSVNQSASCCFEDKMDVDYYRPIDPKSKLGVESTEAALENQSVELASVHGSEDAMSCSNSSMEIYQFNERLELSRVETEVTCMPRYSQNSCMSRSSELRCSNLENSGGSDCSDCPTWEQSGFSGETVLQAIKLEVNEVGDIRTQKLQKTAHDFPKGGKMEKYCQNLSEKASSDLFERAGYQKSGNNTDSAASMHLQLKGYRGTLSNNNSFNSNEGHPVSQVSPKSKYFPHEDSKSIVLPRISAPTKGSEHCMQFMNTQAEKELAKEKNMISQEECSEMLMYDSSSIAETEDKECVDYQIDNLSQEKLCTTEIIMPSQCPAELSITFLMDKQNVILPPDPGGEKTSFLSVKQVVAPVYTGSQADGVAGSEITQSLPIPSTTSESGSLETDAESLMDHDIVHSSVGWKHYCLAEEEQSCCGISLDLEDLTSHPEDTAILGCACDSPSLSSNAYEPVHEEDTAMSEVPQPVNAADESLQSSGEDSDVEECVPGRVESMSKAVEKAQICSSILDDILSSVVLLAEQKKDLATPASMQELVTFVGPSESKGNSEVGKLNEGNAAAGSTVRRTLTYMQHKQKVMQSPTVAYLPSPVGRVKENMRDEDDSILAAFEIDDADAEDLKGKTKQKCCCTIM